MRMGCVEEHGNARYTHVYGSTHSDTFVVVSATYDILRRIEDDAHSLWRNAKVG
jgi:hypothetical protein